MSTTTTKPHFCLVHRQLSTTDSCIYCKIRQLKPRDDDFWPEVVVA